MTEEIKKLIEEEAERYADSKGIYNQHGEALLKMGFKKGANFILSKWQEAERWRKVEEELPKHKNTPYPINIRNIGQHMSVSTWDIRDESDIQNIEKMKGCEWKPIS